MQVVYFEQPGAINLAAMKEEGVQLPQLLRHNVFMNEAVWRVINDSNGR